MPGVDVAEVARGHGEGDLPADGEMRLEVVHDLRRDARPVDRVDDADAVPRLEAKSREIALTMSWQSSKTPRTAILKMLASCSEYICAVWKALMRPCGESMKTCTFFLPRSAYSAEEPVSPEVAPTTLSRLPYFSSAYSNRFPRSCSAMS